MYGLNYEGLTKRKSYEELIEYLQFDQPKIKYPDRTATQIRNSPQLTNLLDGEGLDIKVMQDQQKDRLLVEQKDNIIKEIARRNNETAQHLRAHESRGAIDPKEFDIGGTTTSADKDIIEEYDNLEEANEKARIENIAEMAKAAVKAITERVTSGGTAATLVEGLKPPAADEMLSATERPIYSGAASSSGTTVQNVQGSTPYNFSEELLKKSDAGLRSTLRMYGEKFYKTLNITSPQINNLNREELISVILKLEEQKKFRESLAEMEQPYY